MTTCVDSASQASGTLIHGRRSASRGGGNGSGVGTVHFRGPYLASLPRYEYIWNMHISSPVPVGQESQLAYADASAQRSGPHAREFTLTLTLNPRGLQ